MRYLYVNIGTCMEVHVSKVVNHTFSRYFKYFFVDRQRGRQTTGQTQLLNPAVHMHATGYM